MTPVDISSPLDEFLTLERRKRLESVALKRTDRLTELLSSIHHEHNVSAIMRSADAFGINEIHVVGSSVELLQGICLGTQRWVRLVVHPTPEDAGRVLGEAGYELAVIEAEANHNSHNSVSTPVFELPFERKLALIFGGEAGNIPTTFQVQAKYRAYIPMFGFVDSLNISVAVAICLYSSTFSGAKNERRCSTLTVNDAKALYTGWVERQITDRLKRPAADTPGI